MGYPWGRHHDDYSSSSYPYSSSSQGVIHHGNSYSRPVPSRPVTPHPNPYHHTFRTSSSQPWWPPMASDTRSASAVPSKTPLPVAPPHPHKDLTTGALAAAVVVPILAVFSAIVLIFLCLRRRRQNPPPANTPMVAAAGMKEKLASFRRRRDPTPPPSVSEPPVLTSQHNNAYLTGLDTSSIGSRGDSGEYQVRASYEPPPPYIREPSPPSVDARARSPFEDPPENQRSAHDIYLAVINQSETPRSMSNVSVSSTLYSDNASVHEARQARRSIGGAQIVEAMSITGEEGDRRASNPFVSPISSPVRAANVGGDWERRPSDISEMDRR